MVQAFSFSTGKQEPVDLCDLWVQGHSGLHGAVQASQDYIDLVSKSNNNNNTFKTTLKDYQWKIWV